MLTNRQASILKAFIHNTFKEYTFKELKNSSGSNSNSLLQQAIKKFLKEKLINERRINNTKVYTINHENEDIYDYIELINNENLSPLTKKSIKIIEQELNKSIICHSIIIFGSRAEGKERKESDLDVAVMTGNDKDKTETQAHLNNARLRTPLKLDPHALTTSEFLEMLKTDYENLAKEIARKNMPVRNARLFYKTLIKGLNNGFKIIP